MEFCLFCNEKNPNLTLPAEDQELPATPWHLSEDVGDAPNFIDDTWRELRPKIMIDESHKERTWSDDFVQFKQYLRRRGRVVVEKKGPITKSKLNGVKMIVVGGPEKSWLIDRKKDQWREDEIAHMMQYVGTGGCLLVMGDKLSDVERLSALTQPFGISFSSESVGDVTIHQAEMARHPILEGVSAFRLGKFHGSGGFFLDVTEPAFELAWVDGYPVLAACYYGHGMVVALSNLTVFSKKFLPESENEAFLEKLVDEVMRENKTKRAQPVNKFPEVHPEVMVSLEPTENNTFEDVELIYPEEPVDELDEVLDEQDPIAELDQEFEMEDEHAETEVPFAAYESVWRETLDSLIEVWKEWDKAYEAYAADYEAVDDAEFPEDRELLMDVWERDVEHWQPKLIELMERELNLWSEMHANEDIDKVSRCLLHDLMVNRKTAIVQREQQVEILQNQLDAMETDDQYAVDELFEDTTDASYAAALLRNDYVDLLQNLQERGLPIDEEYIPEREEMQKEDWERGWSIIEWMQPIVVPENGKIRVAVSGETVDEPSSDRNEQLVEQEGDDLSNLDSMNLKAA
jgi:hypothetical protein